MPTWNEINREIEQIGLPNACDVVRKKYLTRLEERTGRSVIAYYSGWLQKRSPDGRFHPESAITDLDMNGFMAVVHNVNRTRGLDLVLHTPGGGIEAGRSVVEYLYKMFGKDIRVIVPQMAMSVGTMMACASREIIMGKHSCLGPTDPQVKGHPAMGVLAEVDRAIQEIRDEPLKQILWQQVFAKYPPAFIVDCERSLEGTREMVSAWLRGNMFATANDPADAAQKTLRSLMDYAGTTEHGHHFLVDKCRDIGLNVTDLENDQDLQEAVLSVHHAFSATFTKTNTIKLIQNGSDGIWTVNA